MKLKTEDILPIVTTLASVHVHNRFDIDEDYGDEETPFAAAANPKRWKRVSKKKLKNAFGGTNLTPEEFVNGGWEFTDVLDPTPLSPECICRHFVNDILSDGLDPVVVTDPTDSKVLFIGWHSD